MPDLPDLDEDRYGRRPAASSACAASSRCRSAFCCPTLITLLALCSGITAIRLGVEGRYELAVVAVIVAIVLDAVDGRLGAAF